MKFTLNWLKEHLDTDASLSEVTEALTRIGLEVEHVTDYGTMLKDFVVATIESAGPHPNAGKLQICMVHDGRDTHQVICGAPNAKAGLHVVFAREGVVIPANGMVIKKTKIRDVESNGMLCSLEELALAESSEGIIELSDTSVAGSPAAAALGYDDALIEIAITPNRGDCFGIYGIARDLAAAGLGKVKGSEIRGQRSVDTHHLPRPDLRPPTSDCPYFVGCAIRGVTNTESPEWLKRKLTAVGLRPISALVDITNYMLITYGRPMHAYDMRAIEGNIGARAAAEGETFKALNGVEYTLHQGMCVIADDKKILGLGGIMGSEASGCQADTTDVFLESALFDAISIATTGRALELLSDARQRFERGVDAAFVKPSVIIARDLILDICGGTASAIEEAGVIQAASQSIAFTPERVAALTGVALEASRMQQILAALGFTVDASQVPWQISVPSWRHDVTLEQDIIEEIIRIHGYEHIPMTALPPSPAIASQPIGEKRAYQAKKLLVSRGMTELCNWSFVSHKQAVAFGGGDDSLHLQNPISSDLNVMRPSLLPHLLLAALHNDNRGSKQLSLCEVGLVFSGIAPDAQHMHATGIRCGGTKLTAYAASNFQGTTREWDVFDAKADALAILQSLGVNIEQLSISEDTPPWYHPGRSLKLTLGSNIVLAYAGELHPAMVADSGLSGRVAAFEVMLEHIPVSKQKTTTKKPLVLPVFPAVLRDFAFLVDSNISAEALRRAVMKADKKHIVHAEVFDVFCGAGVAAGKKSIALSATLQPTEHTFTDDEIQTISKAIIDSVAAGTGAGLRA